MPKLPSIRKLVPGEASVSHEISEAIKNYSGNDARLLRLKDVVAAGKDPLGAAPDQLELIMSILSSDPAKRKVRDTITGKRRAMDVQRTLYKKRPARSPEEIDNMRRKYRRDSGRY